MKTTVFIDRDGTINENLPFPNVNRPEKVVLLARAAEGIKVLNDIGCRVVVVTNQAGINNPENDFNLELYGKVTERFKQLLKETAGAKVDEIFCCPHTQTEDCPCRKPRTGLFKSARKKFGDVDFEKSFLVGDRKEDLIVGNKLKMKTVLVRTGHGIETEDTQDNSAKADHVVDDLYDAALRIRDIIKQNEE